MAYTKLLSEMRYRYQGKFFDEEVILGELTQKSELIRVASLIILLKFTSVMYPNCAAVNIFSNYKSIHVVLPKSANFLVYNKWSICSVNEKYSTPTNA